MIGATEVKDPQELRKLLESALALLSKYARELNEKDKGTRKEYRSVEHWKRDASSE